MQYRLYCNANDVASSDPPEITVLLMISYYPPNRLDGSYSSELSLVIAVPPVPSAYIYVINKSYLSTSLP